MSNQLPGLVVDVEARITKLERGLQKANDRQKKAAAEMERRAAQSAKRIGDSYGKIGDGAARGFDKLAAKIGGFGKAFAGGAALGAAGLITSSLSADIAGTIKAIASLGDEAKRSGLGLEVFQEWKFVAEQNRIGVDSLVDGFKELSLRADEFITTGAGPAAEAFRRIGYTGKGLTEALKDPSELTKEIIDRMQSLDKAAQIRVADELFGGTAGERFVELLDQGRAGIEATIQRAHDAGAVLDREMIEKAAELDRRFHQLQVSASGFFKTVAVGAAGALAELTDGRTSVDLIFGDGDAAAAALGRLYEPLATNRDLANQNADALVELKQAQEALADPASTLAEYFGILETRFRNMGEDALAAGMADLRAQLDDSIRAFEMAEMSADDFQIVLQDVEGRAHDVIAPLEGINASRFNAVKGELGGLFGALESVRDVARQAFAAVASVADAKGAQQADAHIAAMQQHREQRKANDDFLASEQATNAASTEQLRLQREIEATRKRAAEAGASLTDAEIAAAAQASLAGDAARSAAGHAGASGGGGGSSRGGGASAEPKQSDYSREVERIREQTAALEAEAASLIVTAASGKEYADALEYARTRAELLHAAQRDGQALTPGLRAEIDQLAESYVTAGADADEAADKMSKINERGQKGKQALEDMFGSIIDGSMSAKDAVAQLLMEIAKAQLLKGIMGLPGMGKLGQTVGGLLGYAEGGFTGPGGKYDPAGIVHKGEYVMPKAAVNRIGVGNLENLHQTALKGYSGGGLVGATVKATNSLAGSAKISAAPQISITGGPITVNASGGTPEQNSDLAKQIARETEAGMRGLIQQEIVRQMRPGGLMR